MKHKYLGHVILFGTLVLAGLMVVQIYWFNKAFSVSEKQFDHQVQVALKRVADSISSHAEIRKLSSNFFLVVTESELNDQALDNLLKKEFFMSRLRLDYELGIYNAEDDTLVYGNYVHATRPALPIITHGDSQEAKNFAVYFPGRISYLAAQLDVWIFSTLVLLLMMVFFAYAIYSLLRERKFAALKSDFINNMTHEFRTPVTNIKIAGDILKQKIKDHTGVQVYLDILLKENEKLRLKIDQVLLGASVDHMKRPQLEIVDVHQLVADCAEAFQLKVQERDGTLVLALHAANTTILGDWDLLTQAINNVIDNAEKYSPNKPMIVVRTKDHVDGVEIDITDEGIGIAAEMKTKVFEKFFRVRSGDLHPVKGFGLGLSFVKHVIRTHRGNLHLLSELNRGTEVRIILPRL